MHQTTAAVGESLIISNELLLWLAVLVGFILFHRFLNYIIRDPNASSEASKDGLQS